MTLILFYFGLFGVVGFFGLGPSGEIYGLVVAAVFIVATIFLADRLFLVGVGAREVDYRTHDVYFQLQNMSCQKNLKDVRLYTSHVIPENVYCLDPIFNKPSIIFSENVISQEPEIVETGIEYALTYLELKKGKLANQMSYLMAALLIPYFVLRRLGLRSLSVVYYFIFLPLIYLKDYICEVSSSNVLEKLDTRKCLRVTYFLERFKPGANNFVNSLAHDLSIFKRRDPRLWSSLQGSYTNIFNNYMKWHERKKL